MGEGEVMKDTSYVAVCLACHAHAHTVDHLELIMCDAIEDYGHDRVTTMNEEEYCLWADERSMDHDDGGM